MPSSSPDKVTQDGIYTRDLSSRRSELKGSRSQSNNSVKGDMTSLPPDQANWPHLPDPSFYSDPKGVRMNIGPVNGLDLAKKRLMMSEEDIAALRGFFRDETVSKIKLGQWGKGKNFRPYSSHVGELDGRKEIIDAAKAKYGSRLVRT